MPAMDCQLITQYISATPQAINTKEETVTMHSHNKKRHLPINDSPCGIAMPARKTLHRHARDGSEE
jgi:hypothetical protein